MRHGKKVNHLGRTSSHRKALLMNLANALITHKRIKTTVAKAKSLRIYVEPLLNRAKVDTTHNRRIVFSYLQQKDVITELFGTVAAKIGDRAGGYTRIIKLGTRLGDGAEVALIELVDFNTATVVAVVEEEKATTRRSRRGKKKADTAEESSTDVESTEETKED